MRVNLQILYSEARHRPGDLRMRVRAAPGQAVGDSFDSISGCIMINRFNRESRPRIFQVSRRTPRREIEAPQIYNSREAVINLYEPGRDGTALTKLLGQAIEQQKAM
jgi:hypothetical protein